MCMIFFVNKTRFIEKNKSKNGFIFLRSREVDIFPKIFCVECFPAKVPRRIKIIKLVLMKIIDGKHIGTQYLDKTDNTFHIMR